MIIKVEGLNTVQEFDQDSIVCGREEDCDLLLLNETRTKSDLFASRRHAEILRRNNAFFIICDLDSKNGTFVNEEPVVQRVLNDGDTIKFGSGKQIFEVEIVNTLEADLNWLYFPTFLSMFNDLRLTGLLSLSYFEQTKTAYGAQQLFAHLLFQDGEITHVKTDLNRQEEALNQLIIQTSFKGGRFLFKKYRKFNYLPEGMVAAEPILTPTRQLLFEAVRIKDELEELKTYV